MRCQPVTYKVVGGVQLYRCAKCKSEWGENYGEVPICSYRPDNEPVEHKPVVEIEKPYIPPNFNEDVMLPAKEYTLDNKRIIYLNG